MTLGLFARFLGILRLIQDAVHDPIGAGAGLPGAGAFAPARQFIDDYLDQRLLDVRRIDEIKFQPAA